MDTRSVGGPLTPKYSQEWAERVVQELLDCATRGGKCVLKILAISVQDMVEILSAGHPLWEYLKLLMKNSDRIELGEDLLEDFPIQTCSSIARMIKLTHPSDHRLREWALTRVWDFCDSERAQESQGPALKGPEEALSFPAGVGEDETPIHRTPTYDSKARFSRKEN